LDPDEKMNAISRVLVFLLPEYIFEASNFGIFSKLKALDIPISFLYNPPRF
jgi:hypothetical protein